MPNGVMASGRTYVSGHALNDALMPAEGKTVANGTVDPNQQVQFAQRSEPAQRTTYGKKLIAAPPLALPSFKMKMYAKTGESDGSRVELQKVERRHSLREGIVR